MVDSKEIEDIIQWGKRTGPIPDMDKHFFIPILNALGDDENEIKNYLDSMNIHDLDYISGVFEDIYGKFMNDDMYNFLDSLENKIKKYNNSIH